MCKTVNIFNLISNYGKKNDENLLLFSINQSEIAKTRERWWTRFGGFKSGVVCIKIYTCYEIILIDYVKNNEFAGNLLRVYIEVKKLRFDKINVE